MDNLNKQQRSNMMSKIRSKNTKPEIALRKFLFQKGFRYRINYKNLPGKPDIVLPKYKIAIFVHGCFWHEHEGCKRSHLPKSNLNYWENKIKTNKERDIKSQRLLSVLGWKVIVVWECEINADEKLKHVANKIIEENLNMRFNSLKTIKIKIYEEVDSVIMRVAEDEVSYYKSDEKR